MAKTLMICEKPTAAVKLSTALAEKKPKKCELNGVPYYEFERDGKPMLVVPALGHLFTLKNLKPMRDYPTYEIDWAPTFMVDRKAKRTRAFVEAIKKLAEDADDYIVATDFDIEGSLIGRNVLKYLCGEDSLLKAKRMKFSTLTAEDLRRAYEQLMPRLDFELIDAGLARHVLDWYWGMNVSLAMSSAVKAAEQRFAKLSAGRVQSPLLKILVEREREIKAFKPEPFWVLSLVLGLDGMEVIANHATPRFFAKVEAERALAVCKGKPVKVSAIQTRQYRRSPPVPFDLGALQSEAYRCFGYTPMRTQQLAQDLYLAALISYPRTSSQKLLPTIDYRKIMEQLGKISKPYSVIVDELLALPELVPNEGKKTDPAHPSIYPSGERPEDLRGPQQKLYDLIVRRFFSVFGKPALVEGMKVELDVGGQPFFIHGRRVLDEGWLKYYGRYGATDEVILPKLSEGQELAVKEVKFEEKETQPPARYNPASVVKEMETRNLGTKCLCGNVPVLTSNFQALSLQELYENSRAWNKCGILSVTQKKDEKRRQKIRLRGDLTASRGPLNSLYITFGDPSPRKSLERTNAISLGSVSHMQTEPSHVTCLAFNPNTLKVSKKRAVPSKRETESWEKILSIRTKFGSIEVTSDHPIFIVQEGKITCKKAAEIKAGDKLLAYLPCNQLEGKDVKLENTAFIYGVSKKIGEEIAAQRKELGLSQDEFAQSLGVSQTTIHAYENGSRVPISILTKLGITPQFIGGRSASGVIPNPFPLRMSGHLARLFARLTGDGSFGSAQFRKENSCDFRYCNTEPSMIQSFLQDVMVVFRARPKVILSSKNRKKQLYHAKLPGVVGRILLSIAPEITMHEVPKIVLDDRDLWADYLSAFFDDEATVPSKELKLRFTQKSKKLILQVISMLNGLGIRTSRPRLENGSWKFGIYGRKNIERFLLRVRLTHPAKLQRLLTSARRRPAIQKKAMIYYLLSKGLHPKHVARELEYSAELVRWYLHELMVDGLVDRSWKSLGQGRGSMSTYTVKVPFGATFYALLDAEIINHQLCYKPVHEIRREELPEFVYDLSVDEESPAFVAGTDNIIVHNSTRAPILQNIYERGYIFGNQITVTDLGIEVVDSLLKHCPEIVSEGLTAEFEREMEAIQEGKRDREEVIAKARAELDKILSKFRQHQLEIGKQLAESYRITRLKQRILGKCSKCGGDLRVIISRATRKRFAGCSNYPKCTNAFPLPQVGMIVSLDRTCEQCGAPMIQVNRIGMRPYRMCLDPKCPSKEKWGKKKAVAKMAEEV